ncbi:unnamed protein product [Danaus chrysippus]|uniref:(African queen) hypothetical protein n=1 Tax=Danaus chrysippus TaxID=151541 RepID=A0A8J2QR79_9NEOP|nr:unnamed protein product [Danaus chrysippus]
MFKLILLLAIIGYVVSKPYVDDARIVGGEDIDITVAPYQVSLLNRGRHFCGGSIIDNDLILTAAHCLLGVNKRNLQVRAGSSSNREGGVVVPVGEYVYNRDFTFHNMDSDVGLIWLSKPLEFGPSIAPIIMSDEDEEIDDGELTVVTGWGNLRENGGTPKTLQMVLVPKVSAAACSNAYAPSYNITPRMLCAGAPEGGKDACQGDSGGPLVYNEKLAGVVSWGLGCARPKYPGVYAKVSALREWIDEKAIYLKLKHIFRPVLY